MTTTKMQGGRAGCRRGWAVGCAALMLVLAWSPAWGEGEAGGQETTLLLGPAARGDETETPAIATDAEQAFGAAPLALGPMAAAIAAGESGGATPAAAPPAAPAQRGPPLPLHTVEGAGGALFVPFAYLVNPGPPGTVVAPPSASYTLVNVGGKIVEQFVVSETFLRRIEFAYMFGTLNLGDFPQDVQRHTTIDIGFQHVVMHAFSLRGQVVEETPMIPAITAGVVFKYNPNVQDIDRRLFGNVRGLGFARNNGTDFTLTATKCFPTLAFGRPLMLSGGLRFSQAAQLGYLGFGDAYRLTGEGDVCVLITDWLAMSYEYRQKKNPYRTLGRLVGDEDDWQAICAAIIINPHAVFAFGWGHFGNVVNHHEDGVWGFQFKYEF